MTTTQNLRSLIAHTLTEIDREFHGWTFTAADFAGESIHDLREFCYRHHSPIVQALPTTVMI